jgi:PelA/Pel-15E family pectate lyase
MHVFSRRYLLSQAAAIAATAPLLGPAALAAPPAGKAEALAAMKRATAFMTDTVSREGGYLWYYLPDMTRYWGEIEANASALWIQPPGTPTMGHAFLDAYHVTGDEQFYRAATQTADVLAKVQHPSGGWNYWADLAGEASMKTWYDTVGKNCWGGEEFNHYYGNATFDDVTTGEASTFMLRMAVEKPNPVYRAAMLKAVQFVLDSQYPVGGWPQRFPPAPPYIHNGLPDYTPFITFNDDVSTENIKFLLLYFQISGDKRVREPIRRAMDCYLATQQPQPQPAWGLQHNDKDLTPDSARSFEPKAFASHTTGSNIEQLLLYFELTGDRKYLRRIPEALAWLDKVKLSPELAAKTGRTHPTFLEIGTDKVLYAHRRGSNTANGVYTIDDNPADTITHYPQYRKVDTAGLRKRYEELAAADPEKISRHSPLKGGRRPLPKYFTQHDITIADLEANHTDTDKRSNAAAAGTIVAALNAEGYWPGPVPIDSHPYTRDAVPGPIDPELTVETDLTNTSPFARTKPVMGITTKAYIANMAALVSFLRG